MNFTNIQHQIEDIVRNCGKIMLSADRKQDYISSKEGHANFVTVYDKKVQEYLKNKLFEIFPEAQFLGEECLGTEQENGAEVSDATEEGKYIFIVDPIDGTTNFIKDYKISAISVGLVRGDEKVLGIVYNPYLDEMFTAIKGNGAFVNGEPIHVSESPLSNGLVLFGTSPYNEELSKRSFEMAYKYFKQAMDIRRCGSAALDLCNVAAGRAEMFFELELRPWDYAAGALILEEAGGIVTTIDGRPLSYSHICSVMATNQCVRSEMML